MSYGTFLIIALNGDGVRGVAYGPKDGLCIPVIEYLRGDAWWQLVSWDTTFLPGNEAKEFAIKAIASIREDAAKQGLTDVP